MKKLAMAATALALTTAAPALAATQDFAVDWASSSVTLTDQSGGGLACFFSSCGLSVELAGTPTAFTLTEGDGGTSFDFLRWSGTGTTGLASRSFDVTATLAFDPPVASGGSTGGGAARLLSGSIIAGVLSWDDAMPMEITAANGAVFDLSFESGVGILLGSDVTTQATVELTTAAVPLPAAAPLLLAGIGALGFAGRRRKKKAAA